MSIFTSPYPDVAIAEQTITQRVFAGLADRLDQTVLTDGFSGQSLTAAEFMEQVKSLAGGLIAHGMGQGHVVALMAPNLPEYCVIFHAVAWAGGTVTTLNPSYTASEISHQLQSSGAEVLITVPDFLATAQEGAKGSAVAEVIVIGEAAGVRSLNALMGEPCTEQVAVDLDQHTVVLPYSSGTTGLPKGVMLSHRNLVVNVDQTLAGYDLQPGEVAAAFLPFFHIYGMTVLMNVHLAGGGELVTMQRFDLPLFLKICQDYRSRCMWIVPPVALALAKHPLVDDYDLSGLEQVFCAAAPLGAELSDAVSKRLNCICVQGYGMTELSPVSHLAPVSAARAGASGLALPNTDCRIVDIDTGADLAAGQEGELWVRGPQVMQGYLNNPQATAETLDADGWLHTGDIAKIEADGNMFIVDRLKELIKYKGFQVAPAELEATLVSHPNIADAAVVGLPDEEAGELVVAFVVVKEPAPSEDVIKAYLAETLAHYKQVHHFHFVEEIPKSASGKILRRLLKSKLLESR